MNNIMKEHVEKQIESKRREIDDINRTIIEFLNLRQMKVHEIIACKRKINMPLRVPQRENEIMQNIAKHHSGPMTFEAIKKIFSIILEHALDGSNEWDK